MTQIKRGFTDVGPRQMHYRHAGQGEPLMMLHASPGSSRQLVKLIGAFADEARVIAPDTPGNGDSEALSTDEPTIPDLARAMIGFMDAMGLERVNLYGSHTGAAVAAELAIAAPGRVRRLVLDGVSRLTPEELKDILENYAFPFVPDRDGSYLIRLYQFVRDQYVFYPWYARNRAARRDAGLGTAEDIHAWVLEVMKAAETYHLNYRAAFKWDAEGRLPLVKVPTLFLAAATDPLHDCTGDLSKRVAGARFQGMPRGDDPAFAAARHDAIAAFLQG